MKKNQVTTKSQLKETAESTSSTKTTSKVHAGRPRKYEYDGDKRNFTIRLSDEEIKFVEDYFENVQAWVQNGLMKLKKEKGRI